MWFCATLLFKFLQIAGYRHCWGDTLSPSTLTCYTWNTLWKSPLQCESPGWGAELHHILYSTKVFYGGKLLRSFLVESPSLIPLGQHIKDEWTTITSSFPLGQHLKDERATMTKPQSILKEAENPLQGPLCSKCYYRSEWMWNTRCNGKQLWWSTASRSVCDHMDE